MTETEHLLACLAEECAEVAQRADKAQRFGLDEVQPGQSLSNGIRIFGELMDLFAVMELLIARGSLPQCLDRPAIEMKKGKVEHFMEYARGRGTLT